MRSFLLALLAPVLALAQSPTAPAPATTYQNLLGGSLRSRPAYDGSGAERVDVVPLLDLDYNLLFVRTVQGMFEGGLHTKFGSNFTVGAQLAWEESRKSSEASFLRTVGAPDIAVGASLGVHGEWRGNLGAAPAVLLLRLRPQLTRSRGTQADVRATIGLFHDGPLALGAFGQLTWADGKSTQTYYGLPGFNPGAGLLFTSLGAFARYDLSDRWELLGSLENHWLAGDARNSPLTERSSNLRGTLGAGWRF